MRKGADGLSGIRLRRFRVRVVCPVGIRNRAGNRLKLLLWDGNGVWLCQRRLHRGGFIWPKATESCFSMTLDEWHWLVAGVDSHRAILPDALRVNANPLQADLWQRLSAVPNAHWQA